MDVGMLWLDDGGETSLVERVRQAAESFRVQYGVSPSLCLVNGGLLAETGEFPELDGLRLEASDSLLPNYLWIGSAEEISV